MQEVQWYLYDLNWVKDKVKEAVPLCSQQNTVTSTCANEAFFFAMVFAHVPVLHRCNLTTKGKKKGSDCKLAHEGPIYR